MEGEEEDLEEEGDLVVMEDMEDMEEVVVAAMAVVDVGDESRTEIGTSQGLLTGLFSIPRLGIIRTTPSRMARAIHSN